ncbi:MAG TPA: MurR/RpiR family transcriptional regulator [Rhodopila sp.]|uniref:MurR/RpiR family transcriptional regulator n=1 Tax=Rhodopila sp. TaxID=2480087 RepID=UPI002B77823F|nr:MurR/RpiR family transcriptional regulator [Rhodopila sp.]HVY15368.1 MurR/RpiR family transcriptional regulator [Rhodopila sp.]
MREMAPAKVTDLFTERLAARGASLSPAGRRVVEFIDQHRVAALASSAMELAASTGTSDATVVRAVQALGFAGLGELKQTLVSSVTRPSTPADDMRRTLDEVGENSAQAVDLVLETHAEALRVLMMPEARGRIVATTSVLHLAERIVVFGIGPSAALAAYAAMVLERSGRRSKCLNAAGIMLADQMLDLCQGDALLVLAYGRAYREVMTVFSEARRLALPLVLVTDVTDSKLARAADVVLAARRGRTDRVALHGTTLIALEAVILGLAAADRGGAMMALERLNTLRRAVNGQRVDVG